MFAALLSCLHVQIKNDMEGLIKGFVRSYM